MTRPSGIGVLFLLALLPAIIGCAGANTQDAAPAGSAPPAEIAAVDDLLSRPFGEHFKDEQGDYAVADRIAGAIQKVVDRADRMSMPHVMDLVQDAGQLVKDPSEENYAALRDTWNDVKTKIKLRADG